MNINRTKNIHGINYLYYGFLFLSLVTFSSIHLLLSQTLYPGAKALFFLFSLTYSLFEVLLLIAIDRVIKRYLPKFFFFLFIVFTFYLFVVHLLDFLLIRIMDSSFFFLFSLILNETWANFIEILQLAGIPLYLWGLSSIFLLLFSCVPYFVYKRTERISSLHPIRIKNRQLGLFILLLPLTMFSLDKATTTLIPDKEQTPLFIVLPWKSSLLPKSNDTLFYSHALKTPPSKETKNLFLEKTLPLEKKPNIYLFIVESTRKDYITDQNTPHLNMLAKEYLSPENCIANANNTHNSWFSIFHSAFPYHWVEAKKSTAGALPLQALKKMGYQIRVYSSSQLNYYGIRELLFGKEDSLLEEFIHYPHYQTPAYASDQAAFDTLEQRSLQHKEGQLFILFLDSTHFHYSFPKTQPTPLFAPYEGEPPFYVTALPSRSNIKKIQNRYRNALGYVDHLFGHFRSQLEKENLWKESLLVVCSDHGEEFFEQGHMFHASHLSQEQLQIPIIYKFPSWETRKSEKKITSHMDIFPTLLDVLENPFPNDMEGESLFMKNPWPYALSARYNGSLPPVEFCLQGKERKMIGRFIQKKSIYASHAIEVLSYKNLNGSPLLKSENMMTYFDEGLERLFPSMEDSK